MWILEFTSFTLKPLVCSPSRSHFRNPSPLIFLDSSSVIAGVFLVRGFGPSGAGLIVIKLSVDTVVEAIESLALCCTSSSGSSTGSGIEFSIELKSIVGGCKLSGWDVVGWLLSLLISSIAVCLSG